MLQLPWHRYTPLNRMSTVIHSEHLSGQFWAELVLVTLWYRFSRS